MVNFTKLLERLVPPSPQTIMAQQQAYIQQYYKAAAKNGKNPYLNNPMMGMNPMMFSPMMGAANPYSPTQSPFWSLIHAAQSKKKTSKGNKKDATPSIPPYWYGMGGFPVAFQPGASLSQNTLRSTLQQNFTGLFGGSDGVESVPSSDSLLL